MKHGYGGYAKYKCRCLVCTTAKRQYMRDTRARRAGEQKTRPEPGGVDTTGGARILCSPEQSNGAESTGE